MNIRNPSFSEGPQFEIAPKPWKADVPFYQAVSTLALTIDAILIVATSLVAGFVYNRAAHGLSGDFSEFAGTGVIVALFFCGVTRLQAGGDKRASSTRLGRARMAAVAWVTTFLFLIVLAFSLKISATFSRGVVFSFFAAGLIVATISRTMTPRLLARWIRNNAFRGLEVLVIAPDGHPGTVTLCTELVEQGCAKIHRIEFEDAGDTASWSVERQRLRKQVFDTARSAGLGDIYVLAGRLPLDLAADLASGLRILPRAVYLVPDEGISNLLQYPCSGLGNFMTLETQKAPLTRPQRAIKRSLDMLIAIVAFLFLMPLLLAIALAIKIDSRGPLFFRQRRHGYRGQLFQIFKFRTMTVLEDGGTVVQASRNDQRITRVGRWLRKTSLDELPQLWNVLRGEMSIIGPRPHAAAHDALYADLIENYEVRQHVKPGITGWAQVHGLRGETASVELMHRRIVMDLWYASNSSLSLDVQILFKTIGAVLSQHNAF